MPHAAYLATACVLNGRLYVMGGWDSNTHQVLEMTDENGFAWTVRAEMPAVRYGAASVVHEGKIWIIGGSIQIGVPTASVFTYNAEADDWVTAPSLPLACFDASAATIDGGIFIHCHTSQVTKVFTYRTEAPHGPRWEEADAGGTWNLRFASVLLGSTWSRCGRYVLLG